MRKSNQLIAMSADCVVESKVESQYVSDLRRVLALLEEMLEIADAQQFPPEIGARVDETIYRVEQELADCELAEQIGVVLSQSE